MTNAFGKRELGVFAFLGSMTVTSLLLAFASELYYIALIPFAILIAYTAVINFKTLYFILLSMIPFSIEYSFSGSLGTDLPDEPLMIILMLITVVFIFSNYKSVPTGFFGNFLIVVLCVHLFWILLTAIASDNFLVSIKNFSAKIWYVVTFCFLTALVLKTKEDLKRAFWCIYIPLTLLVIQVIVRHALQGFSFDEINKPMYPFFRNHVNYAAILSVFFPYILWAREQYAPRTFKKHLLTFSVILYIVAVYLSYTRTCYLALLIVYPTYLVVKHKLMKPVLASIAIGTTIGFVYLFTDNTYLNYAPNFEETIIHDKFGEHISSTFEGKDVSSMERVYRWVAATQMFKEHPWMGFGPGNFFPNYKGYTVTSFETYVSDNPEGSTVHNYPLLLLTEQGVTGIVIFIFLTAIIFLYGERIYHSMKTEDAKKNIMMVLLMLTMVYVNLLLSDMLETDKVGPFFFMGIGLLVSLHIQNRSLKTESQ